MDDVVKRRPELLGFHYIAEIPRLATVDRPLQAWYVTETSNGTDVVVDDIWSPMPQGSLGSRFTTQRGFSSFIIFALVVIDTNKVAGYTIGSISDYIAMVALSQTRLIDGCGELPSILDLMAPACKSAMSDSITGADIAYLRALYRINQRQDLFLQRAAIENIMMREFTSR
jgi:hypothetical protein